MKNVYEVLRQKEQELTTLQKHVEALRVVAPLLHEDIPAAQSAVQTITQVPQLQTTPPVTVPVTSPVMTSNGPEVVNAPAVASGWDATAKRWP